MRRLIYLIILPLVFSSVFFSSEATKRPVLLVPAVMGSTMKSSSSVIPRLPAPPKSYNTLPEASELKIHDPFGSVGFTAMHKALEAAGDFFVLDVPYDWRQTYDVICERYILPAIDQCRQATGAQKVDIIAHSMGGLVIRYYIQSDMYRGDIGKFIMIGTPNEGFCGIYYIVEFGDIHEDKKAVPILQAKNIFMSMLDQIQFKESIIFEQILKAKGILGNGDDLLTSGFEIKKEGSGYFFKKNSKEIYFSDSEIKNEMLLFFPSLYSLLPTYNFIKGEEGFYGYFSPENLLEGLNSPEGMAVWEEKAGIGEDKVKAFLFLSDNGKANTPVFIEKRAADPKEKNDFSEILADGDGTVALSLFGAEGFRHSFENTVERITGNYGSHTSLPGNTKIQNKILEILSY